MVRAVQVTGQDTLVTLYTYTAQKKLETMTSDGKTSGYQMHEYYKYFYGPSGRLDSTKQKVVNSITGGINADTSLTIVYYPNATSQTPDSMLSITKMDMGFLISTTFSRIKFVYTGNKMRYRSTKMWSDLTGVTTNIDSTVYTYDANDLITNFKTYTRTDDTQPYSLTAYNLFTYGSSATQTYLTGDAGQNFALMYMPYVKVKDVATFENRDETGKVLVSATTTYTMGVGGKAIASKTIQNNNVSGPTSGQKITYASYYYK